MTPAVAPTVALATCAEPLYADEAALEAALDAAGVSWQWMRWDDPGADWSAFDAVVVRTTWDYHERVEEFVTWAAHVDAVSRLWNPAPVIAWNSHKGYLSELAISGVPVVPTTLVRSGDDVTALALAPDAHVVVKPAVSAGSKGTTHGPWGDAHVRATVRDGLSYGDVLVQPFLAEIATEGERSLIVVDGTPHHQLHKLPADGDFRVQVQFGARIEREPVGDREVELARSALRATAELLAPTGADAPLYARVDSVRIDGEPVLMELELIEPDLWFDQAPEAAGTLVAALLRRLGLDGSP